MAGPEPAPSADAQVEQMNEALRAWYAAFSDLSRQFALHLRMHSSDAAALVQIATAEDRGAPLTQTQLARRIGLTTPATSSLLTRLENAGHIERHRSRADRRIVTLKSTQAMHDEIHRFFRG
ncbi:MAG: MarR family transcriptional regulator, partial [Propionibacteriaceae bacterium]